MSPTARSLRWSLAIAAAVVVVDQLTKEWALEALADGPIDVAWTLRFNLAFNKGMAFSQGSGLGPIIGVVALCVVVGLLVSVGRSTSRLYPLAVGLITGGAVGNLLDRLFREPGWLRGAVVDFIDVQWWPIFNVADICVTVGGALLLYTSLQGSHVEPDPAGDSSPQTAVDRVDLPWGPRAVTIVERIPAALAGERLDRVVALIADVSRAVAVTVIDAGGVRVDGAVATSGRVRLTEGAEVAIDPEAIPRPTRPEADDDVVFAVVHVDDSVVVVDKPAGLVVHPGAGHQAGTLVNGLLHHFPDVATVGDPDRPGIVHRLDAGSSGLLVVARSERAASSLIAQFAAHTAGRRYDAMVWGHPDAARGIVDAPIGRDPADPVRMAVVVDGRPARTEYRVTRRYRAPTELARLECRLQTGRTHQIRVHLAAIGHPLVGDATYGGGRPTFGLGRPFLHAAELSFDHPGSGERLTFTSALPPDLAAFEAAAASA